ncbi:fumarylacetoacetase [Halobacteriales archaeon QS_1_68_44]|nr:MAG: fumarylacetoacetase [Halobacteriales archaeon QS_1_68_44]
MKLARIETPAGVLEGEYDDGIVHTDEGSYEPAEYDLLAPCEPSVFYCVGRNFGEKVDQMDYEVPEKPDFFIKPPVSLHPPETPIPYPGFASELTYAGELAAVIGEKCESVPESAVDDVVRGYTILNDLDCLDQERRTARKAFDASGPLGPVMERFTFKPGDVISFGSPANPGLLERGDEIEIRCEGIGTLRNTVE